MAIRKIAFADLEKAVVTAYNELKDLNKGQADPRYKDFNPGKFGISVCLADGRRIDHGDVDAKFPLCGLGKLPVALQLMTQMPVEEVVKKMGINKKCCGCGCGDNGPTPADLEGKGYHAMGVRQMSLVEPEGDPEGKWNNIMNLIIPLMGEAPVLDDDLYKAELKRAQDNDTINSLTKAGFYLYDDATISVNLYNRLHSMLVTTPMLAQMAAAIAADGVCPKCKKVIFDGALSPSLCGLVAAKGPSNMQRPWLILTGVPATNAKVGSFLAIVPGVMGIAAYSPELNEANVSIKAALTIKEILQGLQISALSSARVEIV